MNIAWGIVRLVYGIGVGICLAEGIESFIEKRRQSKLRKEFDLPPMSAEDQLDAMIHASEMDEADLKPGGSA